MAFAACRESFGFPVNLPAVATPVVTHLPQWVVMDVTVPSIDALRVRRALACCAGTGVLRCVPRLDENRVRLEVRLPAHMSADVMHCVMECVPTGEVGHLLSWRCHLRRHGLSNGG